MLKGMRRLVVVLLFGAGCPGGGGSGMDAPTSDVAISDALVDMSVDAGSDWPANAPPLGLCSAEWCWVRPLPQGKALGAIWGSAANDVWVGGEGVLLHYDGNAWTNYPTSSHIVHLWGTAANDIWAATIDDVLHWNGVMWTPTGATGTFVGGTGPSDVWTSDGRHWNGSSWTSHTMPFRALAIGGSGTTTLAVSETGALARWLGTNWGVFDTSSHPGNAAVVIDADHVVIAQDSGAVAFWDSGTWTTRTAPVSAYWFEISATSPSDVWVTSINGALYYHWNGVSWSSVSDDNSPSDGLWQDPSGSLWTVTHDAEVRAWAGTAWSRKTVGDNKIDMVWGTAHDDIWAIGYRYSHTPGRHQFLHWDGTAWTDVAAPIDSSYWLTRIWGSAPNDYWVAASRRISFNLVERMLIHWDGSAWSTFGPFSTEEGISSPTGFVAIWGAAANDVYALARTALYHYDGNSWTQISTVPGGTDVFGSGANDVYVLNGAQLWHWNGSMWTMKTSPSSENKCGWANAPTDVWLGCGSFNSGGIHYDGTYFVPYTTKGRPIGTATHMFVLADAGYLTTEWIGGFGGTETPLESPLFAYNGWRAPDGHIYVAGRGLLVH